MANNKKTKNNNSANFNNYNRRSTNEVLYIDFSQNPEQKELIRLMNENSRPIIFCMGDAGTGKTFTSLVAAIDLVKIQKKYSKIFYIREPIEVGRSLGYLPGSMDEKFSVYLDGMMDNLEVISDYSGLNVNDMANSIECIPPQYIRGRSISNSIVIVDEAQNLSLEQIQTICTRIGKYCKLIFMGSLKQIDLKGKSAKNNDFLTSYEIIKEIDTDGTLMGYVELTKSERSEFCKLIDEAFNKYKEQNIK